MVTTPYPEGEQPPPYGTVVDTNTYAPYHQHFLIGDQFSFDRHFGIIA